MGFEGFGGKGMGNGCGNGNGKGDEGGCDKGVVVVVTD